MRMPTASTMQANVPADRTSTAGERGFVGQCDTGGKAQGDVEINSNVRFWGQSTSGREY
jgi:hypothetical protein